MINKKLFTLTLFIVTVFACHAQIVSTGDINFPQWIQQSNIYEVNVRQYSPEGTFKAFEKSLPRLKEMGVEILWFMPITPISKTDRKGALGSYYAVADYTAVNPEFGTLQDWKELVKKAHAMGFKVITDWVANHSGADNRWLKTNPDFYVRDKNGVAKYAFDWSDTRDLNYDNPVLKDSMIQAMKFWVAETGIDGFRCDVAAEVPRSFWQPCIEALKKMKPDIFMLAEANTAWIHDAGFNTTYGWNMFAKMKEVAAGKSSAKVLDTVLMQQDETFVPGAIKLYFTSNHDENSWNKSDYATFPGPSHAPFAVLTQTMRASLPLIYSGQEEPYLDSLSFFYKDEITWGKYKRAAFYKTLLTERKNNPALAVDAGYTKIETTNDDKIFAYTRQKNNNKILVVLNLSASPVVVSFKSAGIYGEVKEIFTDQMENITRQATLSLPAWGYKVYRFL
ncbi:MAG: alpha-glucosidase C-terminal domain-containing protein [Sphingobacteriales bacterium]|nr:alpha-glucosidase C-terminal domain-containing protein [Sphingobacteriales bacterium]